MSNVSYTKQGRGRSLVLLHGFCETRAVWESIANRLAERFTVYTVDLPGFGNSSLPSIPFSIDQVADQLLKWLLEDQIHKPFVIGHSLGGYVALSMAVQSEEALSGLCLFHSTAEADTPEKRENRNKTLDFVNQYGVKPFIEIFLPGLFFKKVNEIMERVHEMAMKTSQQAIVYYTEAMRDRPARADWLKTCQLPVLFVAGSEDVIIPFQAIEVQARMAPNGHFIGIQGVGHMGFLEDEEQSIAILQAFLGK